MFRRAVYGIDRFFHETPSGRLVLAAATLIGGIVAIATIPGFRGPNDDVLSPSIPRTKNVSSPTEPAHEEDFTSNDGPRDAEPAASTKNVPLIPANDESCIGPSASNIRPPSSSAYVVSFVGSSNNEILLTGNDGFISTINIDDGTTVQSFNGQGGEIGGAGLNKAGTLAATASSDGSVVRWDTATGDKVWTKQFDPVIRLRRSPDQALIGVSTIGGAILLLDAPSGKVVQRIGGHSQVSVGFDFSPDGERLVSASRDKTILISNIETGLREAIYHEDTDVLDAKFSKDGRTVVAAGDGFISRWDVETGNLDKRVGFDSHVVPPNILALVCGSHGSHQEIAFQ